MEAPLLRNQVCVTEVLDLGNWLTLRRPTILSNARRINYSSTPHPPPYLIENKQAMLR